VSLTVEVVGNDLKPSRQEALIQAGLTLASELSLPAVLQKIADLASEVTDASYAALGVLNASGEIEDLITSGVSDVERDAIGDLPVGKGILGALSHDSKPLRLDRIQDDPRSVGFPPNHPPMTTFLGVPIAVRGQIYGNLYLAEKRGGASFTGHDERAALTLAAQAGVAIENARLFDEAREARALQERARIAQGLHDSVLQGLFAMTMNAAAALMAFADTGQQEESVLAHHLREMQRLTQSNLAEMKALIFELRPEALREEGLIAALRKQLGRFSVQEDVQLELHAPNERVLVPESAEEDLYRIVMEALMNVVKHARATMASVGVNESGGVLSVTIVDDGVGFDREMERPGHLGLRSMAERAARIGADLRLASAPGMGTTVELVLSLDVAPEAVAS